MDYFYNHNRQICYADVKNKYFVFTNYLTKEKIAFLGSSMDNSKNIIIKKINEVQNLDLSELDLNDNDYCTNISVYFYDNMENIKKKILIVLKEIGNNKGKYLSHENQIYLFSDNTMLSHFILNIKDSNYIFDPINYNPIPRSLDDLLYEKCDKEKKLV